MTFQPEDIEVIELAASNWAVRSQDAAFSEADVMALVTWLEDSPRHVEAFDRAARLWGELDSLRDSHVAAPGADIVRLDGRRRNDIMRSRTLVWSIGGVMAACLAAAIVLPLMVRPDAPAVIYQTHRGEHRDVTLADGSVLMLNTDTRLSVRMDAKTRRLGLDHGEVALKVVHDAARPLVLEAGDTRITDLGTEFDVLRDGGAVKVAVREGEVGLGDGRTLRAGDVSLHREGSTDSVLSHGGAEDVFAWKTSHAIYRDQPLAVVASDLNRYFDKPLIVDAQSGRLRLTAILTLDSETSVVGRLQDFLPLEARATDKGVYLTRAVAARRRAGR